MTCDESPGIFKERSVSRQFKVLFLAGRSLQVPKCRQDALPFKRLLHPTLMVRRSLGPSNFEQGWIQINDMHKLVPQFTA